MKNRVAFAIALTVSLLNANAGSASPRHQSKTAASKPVLAQGTLSGFVISNDGRHLAEVTVTIYQGKKQIGTQQSTATGEFHFQVAEGDYELTASGPKVQPVLPNRTVVVIHSARDTWANLVMQPSM